MARRDANGDLIYQDGFDPAQQNRDAMVGGLTDPTVAPPSASYQPTNDFPNAGAILSGAATGVPAPSWDRGFEPVTPTPTTGTDPTTGFPYPSFSGPPSFKNTYPQGDPRATAYPNSPTNTPTNPTPAPAATPSSSSDPMDAGYIQSQLTAYAGQHPALASFLTDPANAQYWLQKIQSTGGWTPANANYWQSGWASGKWAPGATEAGAAPSGGGGPSPSAGVNLPPTTAIPTPGTGLSIPPATTDFNAQMRHFLTGQLQDASGPVDQTNPDIQPALQAQQTQSQRDEQAARDALAERYYASGDNGQGVNSGSFNTAISQNREANAANRQNFAGNLVYQAAQAKKTRLTQMLQTASQYGLTDQAQQIQSQIALIDANLRQQGLGQQNAQFTAQLGQQNAQYGDALGLSYAQLLAQQNRDAMLGGLTGA